MLSLYLAAPGLRPNFELKHKNKKLFGDYNSKNIKVIFQNYCLK